MQRDLFSWSPPTADIIPFPTVLRRGKIARTAAVMVEGTAKGAAYQWRRTIDDMRRQMERASIPAEVAEREIAAFMKAVDVEIVRRTRGGMRLVTEDGGAA